MTESNSIEKMLNKIIEFKGVLHFNRQGTPVKIEIDEIIFDD